MQTHYTYLIRNTLTKQKYIGVRTCYGLPSADIRYWGSCATLTESILTTGLEYFQKRVLCTFSTREEAIAHEIMLHEKYDVSRNVKFYNVVKQTSTGFDNSGRRYKQKLPMTDKHKAKLSTAAKLRKGNKGSMYGKHHSEETKQKIRKARASQAPWSEETKQKMSERQQGEKHWLYGKHHSEETKQKISDSKTGKNHHMYGKKLDTETKQKISQANIGKKWYNNGTVAIRVFPGEQLTGFVLGKKLVV